MDSDLAYLKPIGWIGLGAMLLSWATAAIVYFTDPRRRQNRALAAFLLLGSIVHGIGQGLMYLMDNADAAYALQVMSVAFAVAGAAAYLLFLSTLDTAVTRPLRHPAVVASLLAAALAWFLLVVFRPTLFVTGISQPYAVGYAKFEGETTTPFTVAYLVSDLLCGILGLVASILLIRGSRPGTVARRKAFFYVLAFVAFDLLSALVIGVYNLLFFRQAATLAQLEPLLWVSNFGYAAFVLLLGYGILRAQLFDIDLRVKVAISRSTLAALFLGVFLVVEQVVQGVLSTQWGILWGGVAAGLLLFALHPLQRLTDRIANRALPNVHDSPQYVQQRKTDVYRDAVESLLADGELTRKERAILDQLRDKLHLDAGTAHAIESQAWARVPA